MSKPYRHGQIGVVAISFRHRFAGTDLRPIPINQFSLSLSLLLVLTDASGEVGAALKVLHVLDGHLDDLRLLDAAAALLQVLGGYEPGEVGQAVVHPVSSPLFDDPMGHRVLRRWT